MNKWIISAFLVAVCVGYSSAACSVDDLSVVTTCSTNFATAFTAAGQDKSKVCAAFEAFITCINKVSSGCKSDPSFSQAIDAIKSQVGSFGCTSSASGVHMSVVATIIALIAAYVFMK
ncbi:uncharacterized protein LOC124264672 isoform X2 [Haliotis rubra]|uniref:uncharacterized protein LOC124264672 isoform X2 n=1 Tax=Haliotis rubra TaxID=36100 RepID=UPI001EE5B989|nr:uncharacterized protein LOC124264672 isoform X2 [Haliotis rubra]